MTLTSSPLVPARATDPEATVHTDLYHASEIVSEIDSPLIHGQRREETDGGMSEEKI